MKRISAILLTAAVAFSLTACGQTQQAPAQGVIEKTATNETTSDASTQVANNSNILIAYFSVPEADGVDTVSGASRIASGNTVVGNTEFIAMEIQKNLGGDLFRIQTVQDYPTSHEPLLDFAYNEKRNNARPELAEQIESPENYDYIFIGYPNWNSDLPMPLYSFLDAYDFSGKTIIPFVTHGGSGFSKTIQTIQALEPDASVMENGLSISRNHAADAAEDVKAWTASLLAE